MRKIQWLACIAALVAFLSAGTPAVAQAPTQNVTSHGLTVYIGVVPAEIARGVAKAHGQSDLHAGAPPTPAAYHLIVAVFNAVSGERITDATVTASVGQTGSPAPAQKLEPMKVGDTVTYGNFFDLPIHAIYRVHLSILRSDRTQPVQVDLFYERP